MVVDKETEPYMDEFGTIFEGMADRIQFVPRFVSAPRTRPCREPWRGGLVVLANGDVTVCCADHRGAGVIGNVNERAPRDLFNGPEMRGFRQKHARMSLPELCANCDEYSSRRVSPRF